MQYGLGIILVRQKKRFGFENFQKGWKPSANLRVIKIVEAHEQYFQRPIKCELCDYRFVLNFALKQHMRDAHSISVK